MSRLKEEIEKSSEWLIAAFKSLNLRLDYSVHSVRYIDNMIDAQFDNGKPRPGGILFENAGPKLFAISAYLGEVVIRNTPGTYWVTNDDDPEGEVNIKVVSARKVEMYPAQRLMKRINSHDPDGLFGYIDAAVKKEMRESDTPIVSAKPWWKFW